MKPYVKYRISPKFEETFNKEVTECLGYEASGRIHAVYAENSKSDVFARCFRIRADFPLFDFLIVFYPLFFTDNILSISKRELEKQVGLPEMRIATVAHELAHIKDLEEGTTIGHNFLHHGVTKMYYERIMSKIDNYENLLIEGMSSQHLQEGIEIPRSYFYSLIDKNKELPSYDIFTIWGVDVLSLSGEMMEVLK